MQQTHTLSPKQLRSIPFHVRLTEAEYALWSEMAQNLQGSHKLARFVRSAVEYYIASRNEEAEMDTRESAIMEELAGLKEVQANILTELQELHKSNEIAMPTSGGLQYAILGLLHEPQTIVTLIDKLVPEGFTEESVAAVCDQLESTGEILMNKRGEWQHV